MKAEGACQVGGRWWRTNVNAGSDGRKNESPATAPQVIEKMKVLLAVDFEQVLKNVKNA